MPSNDRIDWSTIYSALAHDDRRRLLRYLLDTGDARIESVTHHLLGGEDDSAGDRKQQIVTGLYHLHLPKLVDASLVRWDPRGDRIAPTALAAQLPDETITPRPLPASQSSNRESVVE